MHSLINISEALERFVSAVGKIACWLAVPMMLIIIYDVVARKFGFSGTLSSKLQELQWHFHAAIFLFSFGFAYLKDAHVRIELLRDGFSIRRRAIIEMIGIILVVFPFCAILIYFGWDFWYRSWSVNESSSTPTGLPYRWIIKAALPLCFMLIFVAAISVLLKCIVYLFGPSELAERAGAYLGHSHTSELTEGHHIDDEPASNGR